jgi:hypothetical protein
LQRLCWWPHSPRELGGPTQSVHIPRASLKYPAMPSKRIPMVHGRRSPSSLQGAPLFRPAIISRTRPRRTSSRRSATRNRDRLSSVPGCDQLANTRRGPAHRGEHRQAAGVGAAAAVLRPSPAAVIGLRLALGCPADGRRSWPRSGLRRLRSSLRNKSLGRRYSIPRQPNAKGPC